MKAMTSEFLCAVIVIVDAIWCVCVCVCAVSERNSFDKHFITFHCCSSCDENKRLFAVRYRILTNKTIVNELISSK